MLSNTLRLVLVTTQGMGPGPAQLRRFARKSTTEPWMQDGAAEPAVVGNSGIGWGHTFDELSKAGEPLKVEGDQRTPAGVFRIGASFGFDDPLLPGHVLLSTGRSFCVDDPKSKYYNRVVSRDEAGLSDSGEEMWRIPLYRNGLFIDYPTDRKNRRGSCIFVHIWRSSTQGTAGCVALPEAAVKSLQRFSQGGAIMVILPGNALNRLSPCLPASSN